MAKSKKLKIGIIGAGPNQIIISIMVGVPLTRLKSLLRHQKIVRAMPNLAARVGEAFMVWQAAWRLF